MTKLAVFTIFLISVGCATAPPKSKHSKAVFLSNEKQAGAKSADIQNDISRAGYNGMLGDSISAFPITGAYIEASEDEKGKKNLDSNDVIQKKIIESKKLFTDNKTCFLVRVVSMGSIERAQFKNWRAKIEQPAGNLQELEFSNTAGLSSVPEVLMTTTSTSSWVNSSFVCAKKPIDLSKEFSVYFIQQLTNDEPIKLVWLAPKQ